MNHESIILLSAKSCGSTVFQNYLKANYGFRAAPVTMHQENETLYWTKVASILGLPQEQMVHSSVPMPASKARNSLEKFLTENGIGFPIAPPPDRQALLSAFCTLASACGPRFFEKSPHHLRNWSNLELILETAALCRSRGHSVHLVGLVRNPYDVLYSAWTRWKYDPVDFEAEWYASYCNLLRLKEQLGNELTIFRYEDVAGDSSAIDAFMASIGVEKVSERVTIHERSISKYQNDDTFGHLLSDRTLELAGRLGYHDEELQNRTFWAWKGVRTFQKLMYLTKRETN